MFASRSFKFCSFSCMIAAILGILSLEFPILDEWPPTDAAPLMYCLSGLTPPFLTDLGEKLNEIEVDLFFLFIYLGKWDLGSTCLGEWAF